MDELKGLKALVTGGASGIGLAVAAAFAAEGAGVVVLDLARERPDALPSGLGYVTADISDDDAVARRSPRRSNRSGASTSWSTTPESALRGQSRTPLTRSGTACSM